MYIWKCQVPIIIKSKQRACNSTVYEFPSLHGSAYCSQCIGFQRRFHEFLQLSSAVYNAILATMIYPYFKLRWLPAQLADQQSRLKNLFIAAARDMSAALPNAVVPTNSEDIDDWWLFCIHRFCWHGILAVSAQAASDTTNNKCNLKVLQFLDDSKKDLEMLNKYSVDLYFQL